MPVTFPAHQGFVGAAKLRWPRWVDGTALCVGAGSPDLAYPFGGVLHGHSHTEIGFVLWAVPFTLVATALLRWRAAAGMFAHLPDLGPLRLRSYRVLGQRRPGVWITMVSAAAGAGSHVVVDAFTHSGRWGADLLSLNDVLFEVPVLGDFTTARVLQYLGHIGGTLMFAWLLVVMARSGRLEAWYGQDAVERARRHVPSLIERVGFWAMLSLATGAAAAAALAVGRSPMFPSITALAVALLVAGVIVPSASSPSEHSDRRAR